MRKFLLVAGIFTVLSFNANAAGWYYEEEPQEERYYGGKRREVHYYQPREEYRSEPRYRRLSRADERRYKEHRTLKDDYIDESNPRFYIGADVATTSMDFGNGSYEWAMQNDSADINEDKYTAGSIVAGIKFNKNWGIEAFYQQSGEEDRKYPESFQVTPGLDFDGEYTNTMSFKAYGADIQRYMPVTQEFELLASLGLAQYDFDAKTSLTGSIIDVASDAIVYQNTESVSHNFDSLGIRLGIGVQYNLTEHLALRAMARYVHMNDDDYIKSMTELSMGLRYMF